MPTTSPILAQSGSPAAASETSSGKVREAQRQPFESGAAAKQPRNAGERRGRMKEAERLKVLWPNDK